MRTKLYHCIGCQVESHRNLASEQFSASFGDLLDLSYSDYKPFEIIVTKLTALAALMESRESHWFEMSFARN